MGKMSVLQLCDGQVLKMFRPQELEQLICGGQELDFEALENSTLYDDGFTSGSQARRNSELGLELSLFVLLSVKPSKIHNKSVNLVL